MGNKLTMNITIKLVVKLIYNIKFLQTILEDVRSIGASHYLNLSCKKYILTVNYKKVKALNHRHSREILIK